MNFVNTYNFITQTSRLYCIHPVNRRHNVAVISEKVKAQFLNGLLKQHYTANGAINVLHVHP